ncbi:hypothetical protein [Nannocystis pusilla]|uniref:hypothetical protein n=1 Tax=Nannocystis pusilla TaxID=889268 RepID=UPI003B7D13BF
MQRYLQGVANVLEGRVRLPYAERHLRGVAASATIGAGAHVDPAAWIGEGAVIGAGAHVGPRVQIGDRAVIAPGVRLRDAIVWDGLDVTRDVECAVLSEGQAERKPRAVASARFGRYLDDVRAGPLCPANASFQNDPGRGAGRRFPVRLRDQHRRHRHEHHQPRQRFHRDRRH